MPHRILNLRPDAPDFRDRLYSPTLRRLQPLFNHQAHARPNWVDSVKDQEQTSACTGFALAALVEALLRRRFEESEGAGELPREMSPWMLYYFARRYDEFQGEEDGGSSARAAMKTWHKHGSCTAECWPRKLVVNDAKLDLRDLEPPNKHWIEASFETPLGAYFRVDHTCIPDLHAAINETGAVYATALVHDGWDAPQPDGEILFDGSQQVQGGHAFLLVGYDRQGFWVQNSWGTDWARNGFARLSYLDWRTHAMDAWVGQLGVQVSSQVDTLAEGLHFRGDAAGAGDAVAVRVSSNPAVRNQQINPYVINLGNNGRLSDRGTFRTKPVDLQNLVTLYLNEALKQWNLPADGPIDVALYAHGGLTKEDAAAQTAARWVPALFARKIYPVFFMWETGLLETVRNMLGEIGKRPEAAGGFWDRLVDIKDDRLDMLLSKPGTLFWDEMKENARLATERKDGGLRQLFAELLNVDPVLRDRLRFHLIGHSAGSIFHCHLLPAMLAGGLRVDGVYFMAPACTVDLFRNGVLKHVGAADSQVKAYTQFHLEDFFEQRDTCTPLYNRSLLYMVSNAFEPIHKMPILGMEKFVDQAGLKQPPAGAAVWDWIPTPTRPRPEDPSAISESISHGGFDTDAATMEAVVARIVRRRL